MTLHNRPHRLSPVLVTGGAGYIGSHLCVALSQAGRPVVLLDNFSTSQRGVVDPIQRLAASPLHLVEADIRDEAALARVFAQFDIGAVFHFAGLKSVAESVRAPLDYFSHNVTGSLALLRQMQAASVRTLVFSSSATVYGDACASPITEAAPASAVNPYGRSKLMVEEMLADLAAADRRWRFACLRYFNPVGAHPSGLLGEAPVGEPANLMPYVVQVAAGARSALPLYGSDYPTRDGTGVRDYIHVMDLVEGHLAALDRLDSEPGCLTLNLGTGRGVSVLELVRAFEAATGRPVPLQPLPRRPGDVAECFADASLAERLLGWRASRSLHDMCASSWQWAQTMIPDPVS
ncbi:MAG TPA: UDP-glucose 4-epimerase GalE, partial [Ramlibacter sp.]|nr:UDP-glucose 4-epimerase GalE [Ramlibacter sp.]